MKRKEVNKITLQMPKIEGFSIPYQVINEVNKRAYDFLKKVYNSESKFAYLQHMGFKVICFVAEISPALFNNQIAREYDLKEIYRFDFNKLDEEEFFRRCGLD